MPFVCCVPGCDESGKKSLHSFPKNQLQCEKWIEATLTYFLSSETAWQTFHKVCRNHFIGSDFKNDNLLNKGVVPSVMLPHTIVYEHSYCIKKSIIMSTAEATDRNSISIDVNGIGGSGHSIELEHDYCIKNSTIVSAIEAAGHIATNVNGIGQSATIRDENQNCFSVVGVNNESSENESIMEPVKYTVITVAESQHDQSDGTKIAGSVEMCITANESNITEFGNSNKIDDLNMFNGISAKQVNGKKNAMGTVQEMLPFATAPANLKPKSRVYNPMMRKMRYLQARNKQLKNKLREAVSVNLKSDKKSKVKQKIEGVLKTLSSELPTAQYNFIKLQLKNTGKAKKGNRFNFEEKTLALIIYKQNPKRYEDLRKISNLPTRQTLIIHSAAIRFKEGLNQNLMNFIKHVVSQMDPLERLCTIGWDEMSLTAGLQFDHVKDYIDGFEDLGSKRTSNFATHSLVFMVRGVQSPYKQPISYFLTENLNSQELAELVRLVISAVQDTGKLQIYVK